MDGCIVLVPTTAAAAPYTRLSDFDAAVYIIIERWCQLNRARVAHDARPALSSYQNKCSKPARSHHNSDICNLWSSTVLLICFHGLESVAWTTTSIELGSTSTCRAIRRFMCVTVWINFSLNISLVHSTFCVQVKFVLIVPMLQ